MRTLLGALSAPAEAGEATVTIRRCCQALRWTLTVKLSGHRSP